MTWVARSWRSASAERVTAGLLWPALAVGALAGGLTAGRLVVGGRPLAVVALAAALLPIAFWKRPELGPVLLVAAAATIEQFPYTVAGRNGAATDRIPLFKGFGRSPADAVLVVLLIICILKGAPHGQERHRTLVGTTILCLLAAVAVGLVVGVAHHGALRTAFTEIRPYVYLSITYLLARSLLTTRTAIRAILWALVLGSGFKAAQGFVLFLSVRNLRPRPEAVLGHEEAFFFGIFFLLTSALWLFDVRGGLRRTATALLPLVILADLTNTRRVAWLILGAGAAVLFLIGLACLPQRRKRLLRIAAVSAVFMVFYVPAYWHHSGTVAQPARAIGAVFSPDPRDAASNLYRTQENANLKLNIRQSRLVGKGFGVPINYALPIVDIKSIDPLITYVPHNGVLYIVMRMGVLGGIAFWSMIAAGIISGCRLARAADRELACVGAVVVCAVVAYLFQGYNDQGFFFYRIALTLGSMLGVCEAARHLARATAGTMLSPAGRRPISAEDAVGS